MTLAEIEIGLNQIRSFVVTDKEQAQKLVMLSNDIAFLDTCMFAHHYSCSNTDIWVIQIQKMCHSKTVFIITPLLLYEMQGGANRPMSMEQIAYLNKLCTAGIKMIYLPEEDCIRAIHRKYNEDYQVINKHACNVTRKIAIKFPGVGDIIRSNISMMRSYIFGGVNPPKQDEFLDKLFMELRQNKRPKDSLAEELIAIVAIYLLEVTDLEANYQVRFFSDDVTAVIQLATSPLSEYARRSKYRTVNSVGLLSTMDVQNIFGTKDELAKVLKKIRENYKKIGIRDGEYDIYIHDSLGYEAVAQALWDKKTVIFPCVNKQ